MNNLNHSRALAAGLFATGLFLAGAGSALADVHYVDVTSTNATPPYTNWTTAATNIQDAVDAAVAGDAVVVTNGDYYPVVIGKPLSVRSVNGPQLTTINGGGGSRCAYVTTGATLSGFTLTNGSVDYDVGGGVWGGLWRSSQGGVVSNCIVASNGSTGDDGGGGAYGCTLNNCTLNQNWADNGLNGEAHGGGAACCTLNNCTLVDNSALYYLNDGDAYGGGAYHCTLNNCTLTGNSATSDRGDQARALGGGSYECTLNNCILTANSASASFSAVGGGALGGTFDHCIFYLNHAAYGADYASGQPWLPQPWIADPLFAAGGSLRLQPNSPCINAGNNSYATNATDLDGNPRISGGIVDIGAYEFQWPQLTVAPSGPNVLLSWPTNNAGYDYTGFTLQSTTNLGSSSVWTTNSPAPVIVNGQNTVTNRTTGAQKFYRLIQ